MARVTAERRGQEGLDHCLGLVQRVHPCSDGQNLGIVVRPCQLGGLDVVGQRRPDASDLVRGHLLAVAGAAQHDAERAKVTRHGLRRTKH
jgi:hypothetical protein